MKTLFAFALIINLMLFASLNTLVAQSSQTIGGDNSSNFGQSPKNEVVKNPDILIVTGKILDGETKEPIKDAKINFDKFGEELLQATLDGKGNYALALNKKEIGQPIRIVFKINGYKRYVIKSVDKNKNYLDADIYLEPTESSAKSNAKIKYVMSDDPYNTMVIKMQ
jgi:hypothetical protein